MSPAHYLDYNAGAPARLQVIEAVTEALVMTGNPSSVHRYGSGVRARIEAARAQVARLADADPRGVIFTSGGTEANALALKGLGRRRVLVSAVEHVSVLGCLAGAEIIPVDDSGRVELVALDRMLSQGGRGEDTLVSVMWANNETGVMQPVAEVVALAHKHGALVHCDAAQAAGRVPVSIRQSGVDALTVSSHKLGGIAGAGALILRDTAMAVTPLWMGGGQEGRRRAGTENLLGIAGFAAAAVCAAQEVADGVHLDAIQALRDGLEQAALKAVDGARVIGADAPRLPNTLCLALPGVDARAQVMALDLDGIMVGAGAACSSGKMSHSPVLAAMGLEERVAQSAIRISLGWKSNAADASAFLDSWTALARRKGFQPGNDAAAA